VSAKASFAYGLEIQRRFGAQRGGNLAAAISMRAFLALFPILVLAIAVVGIFVNNPVDFADKIVDTFGLSGDAASTITDATRVAQKSRVASSIVGTVGLVWTGTGLAASITDAWNVMWRIPGGTLRGRAAGVVWLLGGGVLLVAGITATAVLGTNDWLTVLAAICGVVVDTSLFLWTGWILPARRTSWRVMLTAAIVGGVGFGALKVVGGYVVPTLVARSSALYGTIGTVFALLIWMLVLGYLIVYVIVIERVTWEHSNATGDRTDRPPDADQGASRSMSQPSDDRA